MKRRLFKQLVLVAAVGMASSMAYAQSDRPITIVVGYSAGGSADLVARMVGQEMQKRLGRSVIVENAVGASGMIAAQKVLNGPTDGSVIYMGGTDTVVIPMVNAKVKLDWSKDLIPLGRMTTIPMVFAVPAASPHNSLSSLTSSLRKGGKPSYNFASPGIGTMQHIYGALINRHAKVEMVHVPYRGGTQIVTDLVGGQIDSAVLVLSTAMPFLKDGKIKAISVSDSARVPQLPDVKRIGEEEGFNGMSLPLWQGLFVKAGTPTATVVAYEKALQEVIAQADVRSKLADSGITASSMNAADFRNFIKQQATVYQEIVTSGKIVLE
jgi:tripartite-type tricarboxylate transporter receptor subunit TctC